MAKLFERLRLLRKEQDLSQEKTAAEIGVGFSTYRRYETGERVPDADVLVRIADFYGVTLDYLVGREEEKSPPAHGGSPL